MKTQFIFLNCLAIALSAISENRFNICAFIDCNAIKKPTTQPSATTQETLLMTPASSGSKQAKGNFGTINSKLSDLKAKLTKVVDGNTDLEKKNADLSSTLKSLHAKSKQLSENDAALEKKNQELASNFHKMAQFFIKYSNTFSDKDKKAISTKIQEAAEKNAQQDKSTNQLASKLDKTLSNLNDLTHKDTLLMKRDQEFASTVNQLFVDYQKLTQEDQELDKKLNQFISNGNSATTKNAHLEKTNNDLSLKINQISLKVDDISNETGVLEKENQQLVAKLNGIKYKNNDLVEKLSKISSNSKDSEVIFNGYRHDNVSSPGTITYSGTNVNLGDGLDTDTGIFTAPKPGIYFFQFQALAIDGKESFINIKHNGEIVSSSYRTERKICKGRNAHARCEASDEMQAISVLRKLNKDDQVLVSIEYGNLRDSHSELYTQFIGMLLGSTEVVFSANRASDFSEKGPIPYSEIDINQGNGLTTSGTFTAPVSGVYFFHFQGVIGEIIQKRLNWHRFNLYSASVSIWHNGVEITKSDSVKGRSNAFGMQNLSIVRLVTKGDEILIYKKQSGSVLRDRNLEKNTQFMGWLLKTSGPRIVFDSLCSSPYFEKTNRTLTYSYSYGNGLNRTDGSFTAPIGGIYYFHFQARAIDPTANFMNIKLNGEVAASAYRSKRYTRNGEMMTISVVKKLAKGDEVVVFKKDGYIASGSVFHKKNKFMGWLLKKD